MKNLRLLFLVLLLANVMVFVWSQGYFGSPDEGREPQRLAEQKAADKLTIVANQPAATAATTTDKAASSSAPATVASSTTAPAVTCRILSGFKPGEAKQWLTAANAKLPEAKLSLLPAESSTYDVLIAALAGREGADNKLKEVKALGITTAIRTIADGPDKFALLFASLSTETEAKAYLQSLADKGIKSARVVARPSAAQTQVEARNLDPQRLQALKELLLNRNDIRLGECPTP